MIRHFRVPEHMIHSLRKARNAWFNTYVSRNPWCNIFAFLNTWTRYFDGLNFSWVVQHVGFIRFKILNISVYPVLKFWTLWFEHDSNSTEHIIKPLRVQEHVMRPIQKRRNTWFDTCYLRNTWSNRIQNDGTHDLTPRCSGTHDPADSKTTEHMIRHFRFLLLHLYMFQSVHSKTSLLRLVSSVSKKHTKRYNSGNNLNATTHD